MNTLLGSIKSLGQLAGIGAIILLVAHCLYEYFVLARYPRDEAGGMDGAAWLGLTFLALWIACQVGVAIAKG
jgi:hypothetical protein